MTSFLIDYIREDPGAYLVILLVLSLSIGTLINLPVRVRILVERVEHHLLLGEGRRKRDHPIQSPFPESLRDTNVAVSQKAGEYK